jgi:hypothetical protein
VTAGRVPEEWLRSKIMTYVPNTSVKICNVTFVSEKDLKAGQKLRRCSRCKEAYYIDEDSQKKHWKIHKLFCCSIGEDESIAGGIFRFRDVEHIYQCIQSTVNDLLANNNNAGGGRRIVVYAFQQLRSWYLEEGNFEPSDNIKDMRNDCVRHQFSVLMKRSFKDVEQLWAIPGFTSHFLDEELFLSPKLKALKDQGLPPNPYAGVIPSFARVHTSELDNGPGYHLSTYYVGSLNNVLVTSAQEGVYPNFRMRSNRLTAAIVRTLFRQNADAHVRTSIPDSNPPNDGTNVLIPQRGDILSQFLFIGHFALERTLRPFTEKDEIFPGISIFTFLMAVTADSFLYFFTLPTMECMTKLIFKGMDWATLKQDQGPWTTMTLSERSLLLKSMHRRRMGTVNDADEDFHQRFSEAIIRFVAEADTNAALKLQSVWESSLQHEEDTADDIRGCFEHAHQRLLDAHAEIGPSVQVYVRLLEQEHQRRNPSAPGTFPEELIPIISSYCLSDQLLSKEDLKFFQTLLYAEPPELPAWARREE